MAANSTYWHGYLHIPEHIQTALQAGAPVVALESAVITHGLPYPRNLETARQLEATVREEGATPATVGVARGTIHFGLPDATLKELGETTSAVKVGIRDLATAMLKQLSGGTTVASTMFVADMAGARVMATGGIGGVHRESASDISSDLQALATTPMIVVSAGAKAVLDLHATLEYLETMNVPVVGYRTTEFPSFYSRTSGLPTSTKLDSPEQIAEYWDTHRRLGMRSAVLVANPLPQSESIPKEEIESIIVDASSEAKRRGIQGQAVTPFLLGRVAELSNQRSLDVNIALLVKNARLAAQIAVAITERERRRESES